MTEGTENTRPSDEALEKALRRARGLLAKAQATQFPDEAEALTNKAMRIVAEYGLHEALTQDGQVSETEVVDVWFDVEAPYAAEKFDLINAIVTCFGGHCVALANDRKRGKWNEEKQRYDTILKWGKGCRVHVYAFPSDQKLIEFLFTSLLLQATNAMLAAPVPAGVRKSDFYSSFIQAFSRAIFTRLWSIRRKNIQDADERGNGRGTELVLADRSAIVERVFKEVYSSSQPLKLYEGTSGQRAGRDAGMRADLHQTKVTNTSGQKQLTS